MTQIVADRRQVGSGLQKRYGSTVSHAVWVKPLLAEIRNIPGSTGKTPGEDVADPEPLTADHPLWHHPRVMLTPHVASMTQPDSAVEVVLDNLRRHLNGERLIGLVDRARGY